MTNHTKKTKNLAVAYTPDYLTWQLGSGDGKHPTNPERARLATDFLVAELSGDVTVVDPTELDADAVRFMIEGVHDSAYVAEILDEGISGEWYDARPEMGQTAATMFAGTVALVPQIISGEVQVGFNPQGAKHHAGYSRSSGFCVFNDMAWAATEFARNGMRPLYLDWDIHAGDGVQDLLENTSIPTLSIHSATLFPGTETTRERGNYDRHTWHNPDKHYYNWCVGATDGDDALAWAIAGAMDVIDDYQPDVILLAAGADGHEGSNNLGVDNEYTYAGFDAAADAVAQAANRWSEGRVLIGGAGGYQPLTHTPRIWANVVERIYLGTR